MPKHHLLVETRCGLSTDVSYGVVKQESTRQLADCNAYAGALHVQQIQLQQLYSASMTTGTKQTVLAQC